MSLTLKQFRELTKDMPDDTAICVPIESGREWSINGKINFVHLATSEHSYSSSNIITIGQSIDIIENLVVKKLVDKNTWEVIN